MIRVQMYIKQEDLCFFKQSSDLTDTSENGKHKEISPNEIFSELNLNSFKQINTVGSV